MRDSRLPLGMSCVEKGIAAEHDALSIAFVADTAVGTKTERSLGVLS